MVLMVDDQVSVAFDTTISRVADHDGSASVADDVRR
jgi:hypothetical protein